MCNALLQAIMQKDSRSDENGCATDNAISSIGRICLYQPQVLDVAEMLPKWLSWLPCKHDQEEARTIHGMLCTFIET